MCSTLNPINNLLVIYHQCFYDHNGEEILKQPVFFSIKLKDKVRNLITLRKLRIKWYALKFAQTAH